MKVSAYHITLRVSGLTVALILLFDSGILSPFTAEISQNTQLYLANAVGVGASVQPTEINTLTAQISARDRELDAREAALSEREISVGMNTASTGTSPDYSTYILSVLLFIIIVLIVLNYALDFARERRLLYETKTQLQ